MSMFQKSVINKYLEGLDKEKVKKAYQTFKENYSSVKIDKIKKLKEEEYQDGFLRDLFVDVLGYVIKPDDNYNLLREFKNQTDSKKADGAVVKEGKAIAVIELKSTKTKDLKSITQQAFNYKNNQPECKYVITSNFQKLRFYIDYANEYEEFDLFRLEKEDFELLYLVLSKNSIFTDIPLKLKEESIFHEDNVSKQLYKDYSLFKNSLFENLIKNNSNHDKLTLFKKTQKLIDRILFILFSEDRGLLPPNIIERIIQRFYTLKDMDAYKPLYDIYKQYFGYMNTGRMDDNIPAYNGGLFYPDEVLDNLIIDDDILIGDLRKLSAYDFNTEVDVNILGHIFEHSLSEIEEITAEIEGVVIDKVKSKRKKDGVFYTPKYITQYIVENTIGKLCEEKRKELDIIEIEIDENHHNKDGKLSVIGKKLHQKLENYKGWLLSLKILDPACGSGAFLNQALNYLIDEHNFIIEIETVLQKGQISLFNVETAVLENNLYGVDINEESIEIAKLSLWLRTAKRGRKLSVLSNNIKCGNSLIDDPEVAGDKAFDWNKEFPEIMEKGGFDVVIGNPPYGANFSNNEINFLNQKYTHQSYQLDSYLLFIEKTNELIKKNGLIGYIMPNTWLSTLLTNKIRSFVFNTYSLHEIRHYSFFVFKDATVETDTYIFQAKEPIGQQFFINIITENSKSSRVVEQDEWIEKNGNPVNIFETNEIQSIKKKLEKYEKLGNIAEIVQGVKPFQKGKGKPPQDKEIMETKPFVKDTKVDDTFLPLLRGNLMNRYCNFWNQNYWISYGDWLAEPRYSAKFNCDEKLIIRQTGDSLISCFDNEQFICRDNLYIIRNDNKDIALHYLLALLNSNLLTWYYRNILNPEQGKAMAQVKRGHLQELPMAKYENGNENIVSLAKNITSLNSSLNTANNQFLKYISSNFPAIKLSKKLDNWHKLDFNLFITELNKVIKEAKHPKLSKIEEMEWMEVFEAKRAQAQKLQTEISTTDKAIDQMVYELYELTEDEIKIVESNV